MLSRFSRSYFYYIYKNIYNAYIIIKIRSHGILREMGGEGNQRVLWKDKEVRFE